MRTERMIYVGLLILTGILPGARGDNLRTDINPALLYYQAFLVAPRLERIQYLNTNDWEGRNLPEEFGSAVSNLDAELELVRQAAHQTCPCDWGIDLSRGEDTLLPQLANAKRAVIDSQYQIMWDLQNGNQTEACDDLAADFALGRNISRSGTLISALVEWAIESMVCDTIAKDFYQFSPETLRQLADGFDAAPARGTVAKCVSSEKTIRESFLSKLEHLKEQYPDDNAGAMDAVHRSLYYYSADEWERYTNGFGGTIDGLIEAVRNAEPLFIKLGALMALPYSEYEKQLPSAESEFQQSKNSVFLHQLPILKSVRHREFTREVDLAMVRAAVEYKLHGEAGLKGVMDPCGNGPFTVQRFVLNGVDRGFELKSSLPIARGTESYIFVEKAGPPFRVMGNNVGQPIE